MGRRQRFADDTRGVSIALTHALTLGITALLIAGLVLGAGQLLDEQAEDTTRSGLYDVSESLTNELVAVDRITGPGTNGRTTVHVGLPQRLGNDQYTVALVEQGDTGVVFANSSSPTMSAKVGVEYEADICEQRLLGGPVRVVYDATEDCLTIESGTR